ncbi:MAG TPA: 8-amino-7-oxononanoate synthase [Burkholderiales bacterium]|nr:8-amino-7-oxononanoate synthase [Burkholderiales bacterium]
MLEDIRAGLAALERDGLIRSRLTLEAPQGARVRLEGREYLAFCSNDYLGLANHPALVEAAREGAARFGVGAGASHLITGHHAAHHRLEQELAEFTGLPRALLFSTGYMANLGVVSALLGRGDTVFADRLNHASLNDAALLSRARFARYPHGDLDALERQLAASRARRKLVATDAVFSMDGDMADLPRLMELCERHDAWLLVDDAHGFGVLGETGRGSLAHFSPLLTRHPSRLVYMATLGKAAGVFGAFVAGASELVEHLVQRARSYIYTTATPPLLAHTLSRSLEIIRQEDWRRERVRELVDRLRAGAAALRWELMPSRTPIQPLFVGDTREATALSARLRERGMLVPAIRPPTVPKGTARLRISLSAAHGPEDVDALLAALAEIG